jgi:hypothetical protein
MSYHSSQQRGASMPVVISIVLLSLFTVGFAVLSVWAYMNYVDQRDNVDAKIATAVNDAEKKQGDELEAKFLEREKEPNRAFTGPSDFGTLSFDYPKTWSAYVGSNGLDGDDYEAYLHPVVVPSVDEDERFALRVSITNELYEEVIESYQALVEEGQLRTSTFKTSDGAVGTRLDGSFTEDIRGSAVVFKIRDKTATLRTDADTFKKDYDALISTITFND